MTISLRIITPIVLAALLMSSTVLTASTPSQAPTVEDEHEPAPEVDFAIPMPSQRLRGWHGVEFENLPAPQHVDIGDMTLDVAYYQAFSDNGFPHRDLHPLFDQFDPAECVYIATLEIVPPQLCSPLGPSSEFISEHADELPPDIVLPRRLHHFVRAIFVRKASLEWLYGNYADLDETPEELQKDLTRYGLGHLNSHLNAFAPTAEHRYEMVPVYPHYGELTPYEFALPSYFEIVKRRIQDDFPSGYTGPSCDDRSQFWSVFEYRFLITERNTWPDQPSALHLNGKQVVGGAIFTLRINMCSLETQG